MSGSSAYAPAPFDHRKADIILRSSDNIDFRVFKLFLSLASPFFETLFDVPQSTEASEGREIKDGLVVLPVVNDSKTLDTLLRFCYPCTLTDDPNVKVSEDVLDLLGAARGYSVNAIEKKIRHSLSNPKVLEAEPLRCFAIARRGQLREETLLAAKYTLTQPLVPTRFKEIHLVTAGDLLALLTYHQDCGDVIYALKNNMSWIKSHYKRTQGGGWLSGSRCSCPKSAAPKYRLFESDSLQWWEDFIEEMFAGLREKPCRATVADLAANTTEDVKGRNCPTCSAGVIEGMRDFSDVLTRKVEEVVSWVELDFSVPRSRKLYNQSYVGSLGEDSSGESTSKKGKKGKEGKGGKKGKQKR